jgi:hypothetical protein
MNVSLQKFFTDEFLIKYNLQGTRCQNKLAHYQTIKIIGSKLSYLYHDVSLSHFCIYFTLDIWAEHGASDVEFNTSLRYCIRLAHNRVYRKKSQARKSSEPVIFSML